MKSSPLSWRSIAGGVVAGTLILILLGGIAVEQYIVWQRATWASDVLYQILLQQSEQGRY